jgi:hypothetical protein
LYRKPNGFFSISSKNLLLRRFFDLGEGILIFIAHVSILLSKFSFLVFGLGEKFFRSIFSNFMNFLTSQASFFFGELF